MPRYPTVIWTCQPSSSAFKKKINKQNKALECITKHCLSLPSNTGSRDSLSLSCQNQIVDLRSLSLQQ